MKSNTKSKINRENRNEKNNATMRTSNSMLNLFPKKLININDFQNFTKYIDLQLSYYNLDPKELNTTQSIFNKTGIKLTSNSNFNMNMNTTKNKDFFFGLSKTHQLKDITKEQNFNNSLYNKTFMTVSVKNNFYENPFHSFNILRKNDKIAHDIIKKNIFRQQAVFKQAMNQIKSNKVFYRKKMPFMKISTLMPSLKKEYAFLSLKAPPVEINSTNNNNDNNAKSDEKKNNNNSNNYTKNKPSKNYKSENGKLDNPYTKLICLYQYSNKNFPESREQFSLLCNENNLYLVGGKSCIYTQEQIWVCDMSTISWSKIKSINDSYVRFGHTAVFDRSGTKIYLYGGRTKYNQYPDTNFLEKAYVYCGIEYYDIKTKEFNKPVMSYRMQPEHRRNHIAELIGTDLVIMGGLNENNEILNDVYSLNLNFPTGIKERWKEVDIASSSDIETPYLFGHASALAVQNAVAKCNKFSLYKYPDDEKVYKLGVLIDKIKIKGLYIFGGKYKAVGTGGLSNDLYVLVVGKKPCVWRKIESAGTPPPPRYFHSMSYYEKGNLLIVHGGRNDLSNDSFALNDTYIFDLEFLEWHKVTLYSNIEGFKVMPRCAHKSVVHNNRLIIFGGMNNQSYIGSCLFIIRLDPETFERNKLMISSENENDYL